MQRQQLTKDDVEKIQAEIDDRKYNQRPKLLDALGEARAMGDLSENFEYYAAKRAKNQNESRIHYLENVLKTAKIIDDAHAAGTVGINDTVSLYFPDDDLTEEYKLVTPIRGKAMENKISIESPMGLAIRGHAVGDTCTVHLEDGASYDVVIKGITPGTADDDAIAQY